MTDLLQRVAENIARRQLLKRGQKILVAVSGGADSLVLLRILHSLAKKNRWHISVAHFNHRLRGRAGDADEKLVRQTAAALKLPFVVESADVKKFAAQSKLSVEMAARKLRRGRRRGKKLPSSRSRITRTTRWNYFFSGCCAARAAKPWRE